MIPIVYQSSDSNAPVLNGVAGSMANLLKKCLVEGYGEKTPAGWTLEFANAPGTIIALRNNPANGTGFFLNIVDNATNYFTARGFELMTSETEGVFPFPFSGAKSVMKSQDASTTSRRWVLVATDTFFIFLVYTYAASTGAMNPILNTGNNMWSDMLCFGDIIKYHPDDGYNCVLLQGNGRNPGGAGSGYFYGFYQTPTLSPLGFNYIARSYSGEIPAANKEPGFLTSSPNYLSPNGQQYKLRGDIYVPGGLVAGSYFLIDNETTYRLRGRVPGLLSPCHRVDEFFTTQFVSTPMGSIVEGGRTFLVVPIAAILNTSYYSYSMFLIETGAEWS